MKGTGRKAEEGVSSSGTPKLRNKDGKIIKIIVSSANETEIVSSVLSHRIASSAFRRLQRAQVEIGPTEGRRRREGV